MSKLEELIQKYCPDGVEYHKIKEVYKRLKGTPITAGKMKEIATPDGPIRIFAGGKTVIDANEEDIPNANITRVPAVLVQSRGVIDAVYYDKPFTFKNEMWAYTTSNQKSVKSLYYVLKKNIQVFRDAASGMGSLPQISLGVTEDYLIPTPPLPVQEEIVRVLDTFAELQAELQVEQQKRLKQYNYYREKVLTTFTQGETVEEYSVQDLIVSLKTGLNPRQSFKLNEPGASCPYITGKDIFSNKVNVTERTDRITKETVTLINKRAKLETDLLLFASTGTGTVGRMAIIEDYKDDWNISETLYAIKPKRSLVSTKYLMYSLYADYTVSQFSPKISKGSVPHLKVVDLLGVKIRVPSLTEQQRIVEILDRFDTLNNDLSHGLPAEIEKRKQQYEYYRDKLLTFKRKEA